MIQTEDKVELKRTVGLFSGCAYILGTIIGSGIFVSPKGVIVETGSVGLALIIWTFCGVLALIGAMCYAELGTVIPKSGGPYEYIREAFGEFPAFLYCWAVVIIVMPTGNAVIALTLAYYTIQPFFPDCESPPTAVLLIAANAVMLLIFLNGYSSKFSARIQTFFTVIKIIALVVVIGIGVYQLVRGRTGNFEDAFESRKEVTAGAISLAFYSGMFSYSGWDSLNFLMEELQNPYRNLPLCIGISIPLVTVIYVFANVAYFTVLTPQEIIASEAVAVTFAGKTLPALAVIMPIFVACSCVGSLNGTISVAGRVFYAGSKQGHLPTFLSLIHSRFFTPIMSLIAMGVVSIVFLLVGDVLTLINYCSLVEILSYCLCTFALLFLRYKCPNVHRPIKVPIFLPVVFLCLCLFLILLSLIYQPVETGTGMLIVLSGIPLYFIGVVWNKPVYFNQKMRQLTELIQKMTLSLPQET